MATKATGCCLTKGSACRACRGTGCALGDAFGRFVGIASCWEADKDRGIQQLFFFSTPIFLKTHFSLKTYAFKGNYMFPNSVVFCIKRSIAFFFPNSLLVWESSGFFFFFSILYLGCKVVKCLSHSPNWSHRCRCQNHICIPGCTRPLAAPDICSGHVCSLSLHVFICAHTSGRGSVVISQPGALWGSQQVLGTAPGSRGYSSRCQFGVRDWSLILLYLAVPVWRFLTCWSLCDVVHQPHTNALSPGWGLQCTQNKYMMQVERVNGSLRGDGCLPWKAQACQVCRLLSCLILKAGEAVGKMKHLEFS